MKGYSKDLRERIIGALNKGQSVSEVSRTFGVSRYTVIEYRKRYQERGEVYYKKQGGYVRSALVPHYPKVRQWIKKQPDMTLAELQEKLLQECAVKLSVPTIWDHLRKIGISFKKKRYEPANKNELILKRSESIGNGFNSFGILSDWFSWMKQELTPK